MPRWKEFESNCTNYLKDKYGNFAEFILQGGSDSTTPDILVKPFNKPSFLLKQNFLPHNADNSFCFLSLLQIHLRLVLKIYQKEIHVLTLLLNI